MSKKSFFKKTSNEEVKEQMESVETFLFPLNLSMKNIGDSIAGIYQGCQIKIGEGMNGGDLILACFEENGQLKTCVAGYQIQTFLKSFNIGFYLKITRTGTLVISGDRKFANYQFDYNPLGLKETAEIEFLDANALPPIRKLPA